MTSSVSTAQIAGGLTELWSHRVIGELDDACIKFAEAEIFVVLKGVRHNPVADNGCLIMLIERKFGG